MCSLFGLIDFGKVLNPHRKNQILNTLARECQVRGVDATGIAYHFNGRLRVYKRPLPACRMKFRVPPEVSVVIGHTRMTTQGNAHFNQNNHPFVGKVAEKPFALAHNGVLWNDKTLHFTENLPKTSIETDSYIAVQLLEKQNTLDFDSLRSMAETVEGSFVFTVLDDEDSIWFVVGENPLCIMCYDGFLLYASTREILRKAIKRLRLGKAKEALEPKEGEILRIDRHGQLTKGQFTPSMVPRWGYPKYTDWRHHAAENDTGCDDLFAAAKMFGILPEDVQVLLDYGCSEEEIEEMLYDPALLREVIGELLYAYKSPEYSW